MANRTGSLENAPHRRPGGIGAQPLVGRRCRPDQGQERAEARALCFAHLEMSCANV